MNGLDLLVTIVAIGASGGGVVFMVALALREMFTGSGR